MDAALRRLVWQRADSRCKYCQMPQHLDRPRFEVEHVTPEKHGGVSVAENLALACFFCNRYKGPNLSGIDPGTQQISQLFNPRLELWESHFRWNAALLLGLTATGRATIVVMRINDPPRVTFRELLIASGDADWIV